MKQCDLNDMTIMISQGRAKWWKDSLQTQWKLSFHLPDPIYNVERLEVIVKTNNLKLSENPDIFTLIVRPSEKVEMQAILGYSRVSLWIH